MRFSHPSKIELRQRAVPDPDLEAQIFSELLFDPISIFKASTYIVSWFARMTSKDAWDLSKYAVPGTHEVFYVPGTFRMPFVSL